MLRAIVPVGRWPSESTGLGAQISQKGPVVALSLCVLTQNTRHRTRTRTRTRNRKKQQFAQTLTHTNNTHNRNKHCTGSANVTQKTSMQQIISPTGEILQRISADRRGMCLLWPRLICTNLLNQKLLPLGMGTLYNYYTSTREKHNLLISIRFKQQRRIR
jgi:hypothetical protein